MSQEHMSKPGCFQLPLSSLFERRPLDQYLHGVAIGCLELDGFFGGRVQLGMLASLHGRFQAVHKGTALDSLVREVLELIQDDLAMYNNKTLHSSNLRHTSHSGKTVCSID